jgi:hypothetical protein
MDISLHFLNERPPPRSPRRRLKAIKNEVTRAVPARLESNTFRLKLHQSLPILPESHAHR